MDEVKWLFVLGHPKSGTTYLQNILNSHPEIVCLREGAFHEFGRALVQAIESYNEQLKLKERIFGDSAYEALNRAEMAAVLRKFITTRMRTTAKEHVTERTVWLGDKDPDHGKYLGLLADMFPNSSYIHITRDCRDVAVSWWHHIRRLNPQSPARDFNKSCIATAKSWNQYVQNVRRESRARNLHYHQVRYEDLLEKSQESMRSLFTFLGVRSDPQIISKCDEATSFKRLTGGRARGAEDEASFLRKGVAGDWRNKMSDEDARLVSEAAGISNMRALGYLPVD